MFRKWMARRAEKQAKAARNAGNTALAAIKVPGSAESRAYAVASATAYAAEAEARYWASR